MTETADIVVIGGGIIGCAVAFHLTQTLPADARIVLLERDQIAGATSGSSMGHLMVTPDDAAEYALSATSVRLWRELHERFGGCEFNPTGALYLTDDAADLPLLTQLQAQFASFGERADVLDGKQVRAIDPGLATDLPGALFYPGDGVLLPMFAAGVLLRAAAAANARFRARPFTPVTGFETAAGAIAAVNTGSGRIACKHAVVACGVWTPAVAQQAGLPPLPIVPRAGNLAITGHHGSPVRTQMLEISYLRVAHGAAQADPMRTDVDTGAHAVNLQPQSNGSLLVGSTRQFCGMNRRVNRELLHTSLRRAARYVPALREASIVRTWVGLRPYSLDKHPLVGPWPGLDGMWIAAGHEGLGISLAQITGLLLAQQIAGVPTAVDHRRWLPARFAR
jgi:glycine/D-amino acid oxidase-like deaminating enzyme